MASVCCVLTADTHVAFLLRARPDECMQFHGGIKAGSTFRQSWCLKQRILVVFCPKGVSLLVHEEQLFLQTYMCGLHKFSTVFKLTIISMCG